MQTAQELVGRLSPLLAALSQALKPVDTTVAAWRKLVLPGVGLAVATLLYRLYRVQYRRLPHEPPLEAGAPLIGVGLEFGNDGQGLCERMRKKHGPCFTLYVAARRFHMVLDPLAFPSILRHGKVLSFEEIGAEVSQNAFNITKSMTAKYRDRVTAIYKVLHGSGLVPMSSRFAFLIKQLIATQPLSSPASLGPLSARLQETSTHEPCWMVAEARELVSKVFFDCAIKTIFGEKCDAEALFPLFQKHDSAFPILAAAPPRFLIRDILAAMRAGENLVMDALLDPSAEHISEVMKMRHQFFDDAGADLGTRKAFEFSLVWVSQGNTLMGAYWTFVHILSVPGLADELLAELAAARASAEDKDDVKHIFGEMKLLDSCVQESLRLCGSITMARLAKEATELTLPSTGETFSIRKGDYVMMSSMGSHLNSEIFEDPMIYSPRRFLNKSAATDFKNKDGTVVRQAFMAFGAGEHLCPGRYLAQSELKTFVITMLENAEFKLGGPLPGFNRQRFGFGTLPPDGPLTLHYRLKK